eukprot:4938312-Prymnesium_polylepis.1
MQAWRPGSVSQAAAGALASVATMQALRAMGTASTGRMAAIRDHYASFVRRRATTSTHPVPGVIRAATCSP